MFQTETITIAKHEHDGASILPIDLEVKEIAELFSFQISNLPISRKIKPKI